MRYDLWKLQASPSDPENFPFVVIGNKIDVDGGNSRVVCTFLSSLVFDALKSVGHDKAVCV